MKCHYTYDLSITEKILIPECMSVAISNDIEYCVCTATNPIQYESKRYKENIEALTQEAKSKEQGDRDKKVNEDNISFERL